MHDAADSGKAIENMEKIGVKKKKTVKFEEPLDSSIHIPDNHEDAADDSMRNDDQESAFQRQHGGTLKFGESARNL